jgi:hypothetical protein
MYTYTCIPVCVHMYTCVCTCIYTWADGLCDVHAHLCVYVHDCFIKYMHVTHADADMIHMSHASHIGTIQNTAVNHLFEKRTQLHVPCRKNLLILCCKLCCIVSASAVYSRGTPMPLRCAGRTPWICSTVRDWTCSVSLPATACTIWRMRLRPSTR